MRGIRTGDDLALSFPESKLLEEITADFNGVSPKNQSKTHYEKLKMAMYKDGVLH